MNSEAEAELKRCLDEAVAAWKTLMEVAARQLSAVAEAWGKLVESWPPEVLEALRNSVEEPAMRSTRQAVLKVSRPLLESIMPDWETAARVRFGEMVDGRLPRGVEQIAEPYHTALKLPANCRITGISNLYAFGRDEIVFRIESPDFVETPPCDMLPEVRAIYQRTLKVEAMLKKIEDFREFAPGSLEVLSDQGYFLCWDGPVVAVPRVYGPDGKSEIVPMLNGLPVYFTKSVLSVPANKDAVVLFSTEPCWKCSSPTLRKLPDGTAECQECAEKLLL